MSTLTTHCLCLFAGSIFSLILPVASTAFGFSPAGSSFVPGELAYMFFSFASCAVAVIFWPCKVIIPMMAMPMTYIA
jgi:hypothetical protein